MAFRFSVISPNATYQLNRSAVSVDEGTSFTITLTTTGVQNGQPIPYAISGVQSTDFVGEPSLTGWFVIQNNQSTLTLTLLNDMLVEGTETFTLTTESGASISIDINDTSATPPVEYWITRDTTRGGTTSVDSNGLNVFTSGYVNAGSVNRGYISTYDTSGLQTFYTFLYAFSNYTSTISNIKQLPNGDFIVVGTFYTSSQSQFVVACISSSGAVRWAWQTGDGTHSEGAIYDNILLLPNGNIVVSGEMWTNGQDIYLTCINPSTGVHVWETIISTSGSDYTYKLVADATSSNLYVCLTSYTSVSYDVHLLKLNISTAVPSITWKYRLGTSGGVEKGVCAAIDSSGNIIIVGQDTATPYAIILAKVSPSGALLNQYKISHSTDLYPRDIVCVNNIITIFGYNNTSSNTGLIIQVNWASDTPIINWSSVISVINHATPSTQLLRGAYYDSTLYVAGTYKNSSGTLSGCTLKLNYNGTTLTNTSALTITSITTSISTSTYVWATAGAGLTLAPTYLTSVPTTSISLTSTTLGGTIGATKTTI